MSQLFTIVEICGAHAIPKDAGVGVEWTKFTPGVRKSVGLLASAEPFERSSDKLGDIGGVHVSEKECQRISEETGAGIEAETAVLTPIDLVRRCC